MIVAPAWKARRKVPNLLGLSEEVVAAVGAAFRIFRMGKDLSSCTSRFLLFLALTR